MFISVNTLCFWGLKVLPIQVEISLGDGTKPSMILVGLGDKAISESKERIQASLNYLGFGVSHRRITINLSPADLQKEGTHYDLPIALGILAACKYIPSDTLSEYIIMGELALDGKIHPIHGTLPAALYAIEQNKKLICPQSTAAEASWVEGARILGASSVLHVIDYFRGRASLDVPMANPFLDHQSASLLVDFAHIKGQETTKRALEIAAAGQHNVLLSGPPGSGKTLMSKAMHGLLPPLSAKDALDVSVIYSLTGDGNKTQVRLSRPFRAPHHTSSAPALVGGGLRAKPGEISLSHKGILFLDELPEFAPKVLEALREPLENRKIQIARANYTVEYPADFQLIAAMNSCKCGYLGQPNQCARAPKCAEHYQSRISGPLLDRFDMNLVVQPVPVTDLHKLEVGESTETIKMRVMEARRLQFHRWKIYEGTKSEMYTNAHLSGLMLEQLCVLDEPSQNLLNQAVRRFHISARGYFRILKVARTIADLGSCEQIQQNHILEAIQYRK